MKRYLTVSVFLALLVLGTAFAQDIGSVIKDLMGTDWSAVFAETGALAALISLVIRGVNALRPDTLVGSAKYFAALGLGLAVGAVGGHFGFVSAAALSDLQPVLAGVLFGIQAALISVGLHQGVKQTGEIFRHDASLRLQ
jgi:hypothetical protein